jgi:hypothetical protein
MEHITQIDQVIATITAYYELRLGRPLELTLAPTCFCTHTQCGITINQPMAVPDADEDTIQIHVTTTISPDWFPSQLLFQYAHELWHAYEFAQYGIDYPWRRFESLIEPYAYAASLCGLYAIRLPFLSHEAQEDYFRVTSVEIPGYAVYRPGVPLAKSVDYNLRKLDKQYQNIIAPQILKQLA